jgi:hypothetical protein
MTEQCIATGIALDGASDCDKTYVLYTYSCSSLQRSPNHNLGLYISLSHNFTACSQPSRLSDISVHWVQQAENSMQLPVENKCAAFSDGGIIRVTATWVFLMSEEMISSDLMDRPNIMLLMLVTRGRCINRNRWIVICELINGPLTETQQYTNDLEQIHQTIC